MTVSRWGDPAAFILPLLLVNAQESAEGGKELRADLPGDADGGGLVIDVGGQIPGGQDVVPLLGVIQDAGGKGLLQDPSGGRNGEDHALILQIFLDGLPGKLHGEFKALDQAVPIQGVLRRFLIALHGLFQLGQGVFIVFHLLKHTGSHHPFRYCAEKQGPYWV